jgi:tetratricopeptide (TPR) repeat protein
MRNTILTKGPEYRRAILLALVAGIPLLFLRMLYDPTNVPKLTLLMMGVLVVAAIRGVEILQGADASGLKRVMIPALAIAVPLTIAWLFSPYRGWALFGDYPRFTGLLPYLAVVAFGVVLADAFAGRTRSILWAVVIAGGIAGAYAALQFLGLDPFDWTLRGAASEEVVSTLGNPNFAGAFFGITLPLGAVLALTERDRRNVVFGLLALIVIGWIVTRSEGGWAAGIAGLAVAGGIIFSQRVRWARMAGIAAAGLIAVAVIGVVVAAIASEGSDTLPDTAERRAEWWQGAFKMGADAPIVGRGPGTFALEHSRYRTFEDVVQVSFDITDDPHSVPLAFFAGAGLLGLAGLVAAIVTGVVQPGLRVSSDNVIAAGFFGAAVAYIVQSLISIDTVALRAMLWIAIGGLAASLAATDDGAKSRAQSRKAARGKRAQPLQNVPLVAGVVLLALAGLWFTTRPISADNAFNDARVALAAGDVNAADAAFETAIDRRDDVAYRRTYGQQVGGFVTALVAEGQEEPARLLLERVRDAFSYVPELPHSTSIVDLARVLRAASEIEDDAGPEAVELYERAVELDPLNVALTIEASDVALELGADEVAVDMLVDSPVLRRNPGLLGNLAVAYARLGDVQKAQQAIDEALQMDPEQIEALEARALLRS